MGLQLIFVVESNKSCKSDWIYIKDTIDYFYKYDSVNIKFSTVYMDGKGNYNRKKVVKEIKGLISQYSATSKENVSKVIYCFDCDDYDKKAEDSRFLEDVNKYCAQNNYEFAWFCKDIEQVYLGKKVADVDKKKESQNFKAKSMINNINKKKLSIKNYQLNSSNIMLILEHYL